MSKFKVGDKTYFVKQIGSRPYYISDCGEIISTVSKTKLIKGGIYGGYRGAILTRGGPREIVRHHHLVMRYFVGIRPVGLVINHKNGCKTDNRLENLEYCTPKENRDHAVKNRLYSSGSRCSWSKIDEEAAILITEAHKVGMSNMQLARAFKVSKKAITQILTGKSWKYKYETQRAVKFREVKE